MTTDVLVTKEVTFILITNKNYKKKSKASFLLSISFSNSRSKISLVSRAFSLSKSIISSPGLVITSSLAIMTSKTVQVQITSPSILLAFKLKPKTKLFA